MRRGITAAALVFVAVLVLVAGLLGWMVYGDRRYPAAPTTVDIAPGTSPDAIAQQLGQAGVVASPQLLLLYLRARQMTSNILAAEYDFPAHQSIADVGQRLATGGHAAAVWITVPEGFTASQIAGRLEGHGLVDAGVFLDTVKRTDLIFGTARSRGLEGYLFPDTYLMPRHVSPNAIAALMTAQFMRELPSGYTQRARTLGFDLPQIVTIASMIEREAKVDVERPIIAGVIYNRLHRRMPLEIDATVEYALPQHKPQLSLHDLAVDSPYNTYKHVGLPPTPIANPGRRSLLAAFYPAKVDYLYYVYRGHGRHQFSRTLQEQQEAERKYLQ
jgi:UPF0755 protein